MFVLNPNSSDVRFPPVDLASPEGLLAIGGDLRAERLLEAYRCGIFPWYNDGQPILWWSPDPRAVLLPHKLKISRSFSAPIPCSDALPWRTPPLPDLSHSHVSSTVSRIGLVTSPAA